MLANLTDNWIHKIPRIEFLTLNWIIRSIRINTVKRLLVGQKAPNGYNNNWTNFCLSMSEVAQQLATIRLVSARTFIPSIDTLL